MEDEELKQTLLAIRGSLQVVHDTLGTLSERVGRLEQANIDHEAHRVQSVEATYKACTDAHRELAKGMMEDLKKQWELGQK